MSSKLRPLKSKAQDGVLSAAFQLFTVYSDKSNPDADDKIAQQYMEQCINALSYQVETPKSKIYIDTLKLINFRKFDMLDIDFNDDITVIVGINGAGKTSILDALTKTFSYLNARIIKYKKSAKPLLPSDVKVGCFDVAEAISSLHLGSKTQYHGSLVKADDGISSPKDSELDEYHDFSSLYRVVNDYCRKNGKPEINLPLFASYTVERSNNKSSYSYSLDKLPQINIESRFSALDTSATDGSTNLDAFLEWYIALNTLISAKTGDTIKGDKKLKEQIQSLEQVVDNESHPLSDVLNQLKDKYFRSQKQESEDLAFQKSLKQNIDNAIVSAVPDIVELEVNSSTGRAEVKVKVSGNFINVKNLSKGQQVSFSLVADIARRLVLLNPSLSNPMNGQGIILIDEVELHLHPSWQQTIISILTDSFKNIQFILTTHSPQVLSTLHSSKLRLLGKNNNGQYVASEPNVETFAYPNSDVMHSIMNVNPIPNLPVIKTLTKYRKLIEQGDYDDSLTLSNMKKLHQELIEELGESHPELILLERVKERRELIG